MLVVFFVSLDLPLKFIFPVVKAPELRELVVMGPALISLFVARIAEILVINAPNCAHLVVIIKLGFGNPSIHLLLDFLPDELLDFWLSSLVWEAKARRQSADL